MADINQCTSRTLASKSGISSELASRIVNFRKFKGNILSFSDLWYVDGMTRPIMKTLMQNCAITDTRSKPVNINNNSNRKSNGKLKPKPKQKSAIQKQKFSKMNSRFLESLPLMSESHESDESDNLLTVYAPMVVQSTPSRERIITLYQIASPSKIKSPEKLRGIPPRRKERCFNNQCNDHLKLQTGSKLSKGRNIVEKSPSPRKRKDKGLTHSKEKSVKEWLQKSISENNKRLSARAGSHNHGRSRSRNRDRYYRDQSDSRSRSGSRSPLLRQTYGGNRNVKNIKPQHSGIQTSLKKKAKIMTHGSNIRREISDKPLTLLDLEAPTDEDSEKHLSKSRRRFIRSRESSPKSVKINTERRESPRKHMNQPSPLPQASSSVRQKLEITETSKDPGGRNITRRSLWKDKRRSRSLNDRHHRHCRFHRSKSYDRHRSPDKRHRDADSSETNEFCVIL